VAAAAWVLNYTWLAAFQPPLAIVPGGFLRPLTVLRFASVMVMVMVPCWGA
jgi:hypothetical protein